jgi:hypothetical protein
VEEHDYGKEDIEAELDTGAIRKGKKVMKKKKKKKMKRVAEMDES